MRFSDLTDPATGLVMVEQKQKIKNRWKWVPMKLRPVDVVEQIEQGFVRLPEGHSEEEAAEEKPKGKPIKEILSDMDRDELIAYAKTVSVDLDLSEEDEELRQAILAVVNKE